MNNKNSPEIRFSLFKGDLQQFRADEIFASISDKNHPQLPVLSASQKRGMVYRDDIGIDIQYDEKTTKNYKRVTPGQFVIHLRSFQGGFAYSEIEGITSPAYTVLDLKGKSNYYPLYWRYILSSEVFIKRLEAITYGIRDGRSISYNEFSTLKFQVPVYSEQIKIGEFFRQIDKTITLQQQELTILKQTKQGFLQKMFPKEGEAVPEVRFPGFNEEWNMRRLGGHAEILTGGTPKTKVEEYWYPKEVPWMSSGEVNKKRLSSTDNMVSNIGLENSSARWVKENSVLIALAGQGKTRGTVAINEVPLTTNQSIAAIVPNGELHYEFIFYNLENRYLELRLISSGDGTRGGLNKKIVSDILINSPLIEEQIQIGNFFKQLDEVIALHEQELEALQQTKKAFLQKMFV